MMIFEACVENLEEALRAEQHGAHQLELCSDLLLNGLTPTDDLIQSVMQAVTIPVHVMVRPRAGDFIYSKEEFEAMLRSIEQCKKMGVAGVVFGILSPDQEPDLKRTQQLARAAKPLLVTFHKAIDETSDPIASARMLNSVSEIDFVLSSGGASTAEKGKKTLQRMVQKCSRIRIKIAGKVNTTNRQQLSEFIGSEFLHGKNVV